MNARRALSAILCFVLISVLFSSCGGDELKAYYFAVNEAAYEFDSAIAAEGTASLVVRNCFEGLVYTDTEGNILPAAAESWTVSEDGLTYTFRLRSGMKWHITSNATEELEGKLPENFDLSVTAGDFEFALKRVIDPATGSQYSYKLINIAGAKAVIAGDASVDELGIKALSDTELQIKLSIPQSDFPAVLAEPFCSPCNETFFNACAGRYGRYIRYTLSNGPFYLSYFDEDTYRMTKNPDYNGNYAPKVDVVRFYVTSDDTSLYSKLKSGDYSGAFMTEAQYTEYKVPKKSTVLTLNDKVRAFVFNEKSEFLSNSAYRKAVSLATDRDAFAEMGEHKAVNSILPSMISSSTVSFSHEFNEEKAAEILNAALTEEDRTSITVTVICEPKYEILLKKQLQNWQKTFGTAFVFNVETFSESEILEKVGEGDFDIAFYPLSADSFSVTDFLSCFVSSSPDNCFGAASSELDSAIDSLGGASAEEFDGKYETVLSLLSEEAVLIPIWSESSYFVCNEDVNGVIFLPGYECAYFHSCY